MTVSDELLQEVKDYLRITWDDTTEDKRLKNIINRVGAYMERVTGTSFAFVEEDEAKQLLFDGTRYAHNNAFEYFQENFLGQIQSLQFKVAVADAESQP
ncbi:phage gp6-like head-tail connector protein [Listeria booriae]|uniref:Phage gp6-like head-tail connector protein n=1 Tax=Listeria booriae TaxID=1552123 RepID=A0A7X1A4K3_9LIST|nr:phage head-tail connector protein [Listeria booriae]MBC2048210.1 phage gp6-like head-tail connector protein [Listeria booriae]MBC2263699.1 phage gp6-like head-tail connector protein [Listeria booriae]MBC2370534.1 phage gp6-like head-tail connector protein [Listeria booriae]